MGIDGVEDSQVGKSILPVTPLPAGVQLPARQRGCCRHEPIHQGSDGRIALRSEYQHGGIVGSDGHLVDEVYALLDQDLLDSRMDEADMPPKGKLPERVCFS